MKGAIKMADVITKLVDKFIELFQSFLKEAGLWETLSDLAEKWFG